MSKKSSAKKTKNPSKLPEKIKNPLVFFPYRNFFLIFAGLIFLIVLSFGALAFFLSDKIYPEIKVAGVQLTALTKEEAEQKIAQQLQKRLETPLSFSYFEATTSSTSKKSRSYKINLIHQSDNIKLKEAVEKAFEFGHKKPYLPPKSIDLEVSFDTLFNSELEAISLEIDEQAINSQLKVEDDQITVTPSQDGYLLDKELLKHRILEYVNTGNLQNTALPIKKVSPKLSYEQALNIKRRLDEIKITPVKLVFEDLEFTLDLETTLSLIDLEDLNSSVASVKILDNLVNVQSVSVSGKEVSDMKLTLNKSKLNDYLKNLSTQIDRPVVEPLFAFENNRVTEFQPPQEGRRLNIGAAQAAISNALVSRNQTEVTLPVEVVKPKNKLTNDLGIKELIGQGVSNFAGSIENRMFNVRHGASKINGVLIAPNEEFSFNKTVGDITAATGFKQAYVIKSGRTVLDDGGGICQVSTTLFRSVLNSGLPIVSRTAHAYRVTYYEQGFPPGLDATIFYPSVDFKFKNDTGSHILIQAYVVGTTMYVDLYGSKDGRIVNMTNPVIGSTSPPPPELRQDDPTLPKGTVKQVDWSAWGANVTFKRQVIKNGQTIIDESFRSNYRPWQAVYLVGTKEG
jgi:vancomycin resistance protein YoaR